MNIKVAVAYHKQSKLLIHESLLPIHVGKALSSVDLGIAGDDVGDNISKKNPVYCELTALYWLWKNVDADYKGLFHYRRCFSVEPSHKRMVIKQKMQQTINKFLIPINLKTEAAISILYKCNSEDEFEDKVNRFCKQMPKLLRKANLLVPYPITFLSSEVIDHFSKQMGQYYLMLLDEIVKKYYPQLYHYYEMAMHGHVLYFGNMSVMDNNTFNEYCSVLFDILKIHEEEVVKRNYIKDVYSEGAYSRISGYLGEILTSTFILYCKDSRIVKDQPVCFLEIKG